MAPRKGKEKKEEQVISLGPQVAEGENVFGVCHIFASFNDTFVHVTDLSGKWVQHTVSMVSTTHNCINIINLTQSIMGTVVYNIIWYLSVLYINI